MDEIDSLRRTLSRARRALQILEEEAAGYTALTRPPHLQIELEEQSREVASLEARLALLIGGDRTAVPDNLPARPPVFVGRQAELRRCLEALSPDERGWGVMIDGQGGMGKTALALEVAHDARQKAAFDAYVFISAKTLSLSPEGVRQETLALTSLDAFVRETARLISCEDVCRTPEATERRRALLEALRGRRVLLVWDNLETLTQEERDLIAEFVRKLPGSNKVILTSRRRTGESALMLRLDKLSEAEAAELLAALGQRYPRLAAELAAAGEAGRRALYDAAGGNPLVLHYAAGFVAQKGLSLAQATARVEDADRSGDLYGFLFDDAAGDLQPPDRAVLSALSGFATPADITALQEVTQLTSREVETALERLVTLSLVNDLEGGHYGLHPLTRSYVRAALASPVPTPRQEVTEKPRRGTPTTPLDPNARRATLRYWVEFAQKYGGYGKDAYQTYDCLVAEWSNLEATATQLWVLTGLPDALTDPEAARLLTQLAQALGQFLWFRGYWDECVRLSEWAYTAAVAVEDWPAAGWRAYDVAWIAYHRAETERADAWATLMAAVMERGGSQRDCAAAARLRGVVAEQRREFVEAERLYAEALAAYRDLGAEAGQASVLNDLGNVARARGDYDCAQMRYCEALTLAEKAGNQELQANFVSNLGSLALDRGRFVEARLYFEQALTLGHEVRREDQVAFANWGLARVLENKGQYREALGYAEEALRIYERLRHQGLEAARALVARLRSQ